MKKPRFTGRGKMRPNRAVARSIAVIFVIAVFGLMGIGGVLAQGPGGTHTIAGKVYDSQGQTPANGFDGVYAAVIVEHKGFESTYVDPDGLELGDDGHYWYVVDIPEEGWETDDQYWIQINGTGWGDLNYTCTGHGNPEVSSWRMTSAGSEQRDVNTLHSLPEVPPEPSNYKPLIALIFALILSLVGIVIGIVRPLKIPASGWPRRQADLTDDILIGAKKKEAAAAPSGERTCKECGGKLEYMAMYDKWYCRKCKQYERKALPPPPVKMPSEERKCKTCDSSMEFKPAEKQWYCNTCQKFERKELPPPPPKEPPKKPAEEHICKTCQVNMRYAAKYDRWYCPKCLKYEALPEKEPKEPAQEEGASKEPLGGEQDEQ